MTQEEFKKLFKLHWEWQQGIFITKVQEEKGLIYYFGPIKSEFFDVVLPQFDNPNKLDLKSVAEKFKQNNEIPSFYIIEELQKKGFVEYLVKAGYSLAGADTWMVFNTNNHKTNKPIAKVKTITPDTFKDYHSVLGPIFSDFPGNEKYLEICRQSLSKHISNNEFKDLKNELYLIYDNDKPASGAGMFYSVDKNFAYLHDAGTLEKFRGKGYQTDLIRFRTNKALQLGITRIYSLVEHGGHSWKNMIRNGFDQVQMADIVTLKHK